MPNQIIKVSMPLPVSVPRGALWVGAVAAAVAAGWRRASNWADRARQDTPADSAHDLLSLARSVEHETPKLAAELRAIAMHRPRAQS